MEPRIRFIMLTMPFYQQGRKINEDLEEDSDVEYDYGEGETTIADGITESDVVQKTYFDGIEVDEGKQ